MSDVESVRCAGTSTRPGRTCSRPAAGPTGSAIDTLWTWDHLYPIVGQPDRPDPRGLADAGGLGPGDRADPDRPDGRRQHVPRAGADREDGHDPRPHLERPGDPRHRRRRGSRRSTRPSASRSGAASRSGCAGSARRCRSCAACSTASARRRPARATRRRTSATTRRRSSSACRSSIGGGGEQVTLKLVARYADANNVGGGIENVRRKEAILLQHCETVGRDPAEIERTTGLGTVIIRDSRAEAERVQPRCSSATASADAGRTSRSARPRTSPSGCCRTSRSATATSSPGFPSPHDEESMTRLATEVRPILERRADTASTTLLTRTA